LCGSAGGSRSLSLPIHALVFFSCFAFVVSAFYTALRVSTLTLRSGVRRSPRLASSCASSFGMSLTRSFTSPVAAAQAPMTARSSPLDRRVTVSITTDLWKKMRLHIIDTKVEGKRLTAQALVTGLLEQYFAGQ